MAKLNEEQPIIFRYQNTTKEWSKTIKDGYYFFNEKGYPVSENEKAAYFYRVKDHGYSIENIKNSQQKGIYVSQSNTNQEIIMINNGSWTEAKRVPKCLDHHKIYDRLISNDIVLDVSDICLNNKQIMLVQNPLSDDHGDYMKYDGVTAVSNDQDLIYSFTTKENKK